MEPIITAEQVAELNEKIATLEEEKKGQAIRITNLENQLDQLEESPEPCTNCATLNDQIKEQEGTIELLNKVIGAAQSAPTVAAKTNAAIPAEEVEIHGEKFKFLVAQFRLPADATIYSAADVLQDEKMLDRILSIKGQKILKALV